DRAHDASGRHCGEYVDGEARADAGRGEQAAEDCTLGIVDEAVQLMRVLTHHLPGAQLDLRTLRGQPFEHGERYLHFVRYAGGGHHFCDSDLTPQQHALDPADHGSTAVMRAVVTPTLQ